MKKFLILIGAVVVSHMASAAYLYWQLDTTDYTGGAAYDSVRIVDGAGKAVTLSGLVWDEDVGDYVIGQVAPSDVRSGVTYGINSEDIKSDYSYYVELYNSANPETYVSKSSEVSGSDLIAYSNGVNVSEDLTTDSYVPVWHSSGDVDPAPEPTSAILMLFGAAMLGLKRKQRRLA